MSKKKVLLTRRVAPGKKPFQPQELSPAIVELIAIGASIASNCEPCFKYHFNEARKLKVSKRDIAKAVATGVMVKEAPDQSIRNLARKHVKGFSIEPDEAPSSCRGTAGGKSSKCCGS